MFRCLGISYEKSDPLLEWHIPIRLCNINSTIQGAKPTNRWHACLTSVSVKRWCELFAAIICSSCRMIITTHSKVNMHYIKYIILCRLCGDTTCWLLSHVISDIYRISCLLLNKSISINSFQRDRSQTLVRGVCSGACSKNGGIKFLPLLQSCEGTLKKSK